MLAITVGGTAIGALLALRGAAVLDGSPLRIDDVVELAVLAVGTLTATWLVGSSLVAATCITAQAVGHRWHRGERLVARHGPALVRRAARLSVTVGVGAGLSLAAPTAFASAPGPSVPDPPDAGSTTATASVVGLGWQPTTGSTPAEQARPAVLPETAERAEPAPAPTTGTRHTARAVGHPVPTAEPAAHEVVVARGDTLWAIAADSVPADATTSDIADATLAWYAGNAELIGDDPDLIVPGQHLLPPT